MFAVTIAHTFEAAHRLPHLGGKCASLHGHSWRVQVTVTAPELTDQHTVVEFADLKHTARTWVDSRLDHGTMIGAADPLLPALLVNNCKTFVFGPGGHWEGASWPTVEAVACLLAERARGWLAQVGAPPGAHVSRVTVAETPVNTAHWTAP